MKKKEITGKKYDPKKIESKWVKVWDKQKLFKSKVDIKKKKKYILDMFPYPSGEGLHVGHPKGYIATDVYSRMYKMKGYNILRAMGWDAFGLPAEQFALKNKVNPKISTKKNTDNYKKQLSKIGFNYDWEREVNTTSPDFYKWTQFIFKQLYKAGLCYESFEPINWCPSCKTGLANEDLEDGKCERCSSLVEKKPIRQWVIKITEYAEKLLSGLDEVGWKENIKDMQRDWIGKSEGAEIEFKLHSTLRVPKLGLPPTLSQGEGAVPGYMTGNIKNYDLLQTNAIKMRQNPTETENILWQELRADKLDVKFRRQHVVSNFIVDFVSLEKMLIIEVDGEIHNTQKEKDVERDLILESLGFRVLRFTSNIVFNDLKSVTQKIKLELENNVKLQALPVGGGLGGAFTVFTTRPDTLFGCTYCVFAPEHKLVREYLDKNLITNKIEVEKYIQESKSKSEIERTSLGKEKTGVKLDGVYAVNPANQKQVPVYIADYVLSTYGSGAIMAVPAHDERDYEFAKKFNIEIISVVANHMVGEGEYAPKKDVKTNKRNVVDVIVENTRGEIMLISENSSGTENFYFPGGGIGELGRKEAAEKEVEEETGYNEFEEVREIPNTYKSLLSFRHTKNVNQHNVGNGFYIKLKSENKVKSEAEEGRHKIHWVKKGEVDKYLNWPNHIETLWRPFTNPKYLFTGGGELVNSEKFDGMGTEEAKKKIVEFVGGKMVTKYRLKDWVFARQRYWGEPFPIVYSTNPSLGQGNTWGEAEGGGSAPEGVKKIYLVADKELPVKLPDVKNYEPTGDGESPLKNIKKWVEVYGFINKQNEFESVDLKKVKKIKKGTTKEALPIGEGWVGLYKGQKIKKFFRETNTMPQWAGSSWYWLRYMDPKNKKNLVGKKEEKYWGQVDLYCGGMEHATRHLIYGRFWNRFMYDQKLISTKEPFNRLEGVGLIMASDGRKMSKRYGNVINPDDVIARFGADTFRMYEMFIGAFHDTVDWSENGLVGPRRFIERVWAIQEKVSKDKKFKDNEEILILLNQTIKKVSEDLEEWKFNTAISQMMIFMNEFEKQELVSVDSYKKLLQLLSPICPFFTDEIWQNLGEKKSVYLSSWPLFDAKKIQNKNVNIALQVNGKLRDTFSCNVDMSDDEIKKLAENTEGYKKWVTGNTIHKIIVIKNKIVNVVI